MHHIVLPNGGKVKAPFPRRFITVYNKMSGNNALLFLQDGGPAADTKEKGAVTMSHPHTRAGRIVLRPVPAAPAVGFPLPKVSPPADSSVTLARWLDICCLLYTSPSPRDP